MLPLINVYEGDIIGESAIPFKQSNGEEYVSYSMYSAQVVSREGASLYMVDAVKFKANFIRMIADIKFISDLRHQLLEQRIIQLIAQKNDLTQPPTIKHQKKQIKASLKLKELLPSKLCQPTRVYARPLISKETVKNFNTMDLSISKKSQESRNPGNSLDLFLQKSLSKERFDTHQSILTKQKDPTNTNISAMQESTMSGYFAKAPQVSPTEKVVLPEKPSKSRSDKLSSFGHRPTKLNTSMFHFRNSRVAPIEIQSQSFCNFNTFRNKQISP